MSGKPADKRELLKLVGVKRHFQVRGGIPLIRKPLAVRAVDGVDLTVTRGETLSLVGESGSGKTTLGRVALGLQPTTAGSVTFDGREIKKLSAAERRALRKRMQIVFQDPFGSLNPRLPIGDQIEEGLLAHKLGEHAAREKRVREVLDLVGLDPNYDRDARSGLAPKVGEDLLFEGQHCGNALSAPERAHRPRTVRLSPRRA